MDTNWTALAIFTGSVLICGTAIWITDVLVRQSKFILEHLLLQMKSLEERRIQEVTELYPYVIRFLRDGGLLAKRMAEEKTMPEQFIQTVHDKDLIKGTPFKSMEESMQDMIEGKPREDKPSDENDPISRPRAERQMPPIKPIK